MELLISLGIGYLLDLVFGDPQWLPHPIRAIGFMISRGETLLRRILPRHELFAGTLLSITTVLVSYLLPFLVLYLLGLWNVYVKIAVEAFFCYQILATKSLRVESMYVYRHLINQDIPGARKALSRIVGRDTETLSQDQIIKAAVETVSENTSDGVIAPMIFLVIGGAPLGFFYKAVNTLDSMIGYKNDRYLLFGRFAARLDDICNYVPARISGVLMIAAAFMTGFDGKSAARIYRRDREKHASPNSAQTESVCAGALHIQLAGDASYFGKIYHKPTIGDEIRHTEAEDIRNANRLMYGTSMIGVILLSALRFSVGVLLFILC